MPEWYLILGTTHATYIELFVRSQLRNPYLTIDHMGGCQNYGPFLGTLNIWCGIIIGIQKGTIILTTTRMLRNHQLLGVPQSQLLCLKDFRFVPLMVVILGFGSQIHSLRAIFLGLGTLSLRCHYNRWWFISWERVSPYMLTSPEY